MNEHWSRFSCCISYFLVVLFSWNILKFQNIIWHNFFFRNLSKAVLPTEWELVECGGEGSRWGPHSNHLSLLTTHKIQKYEIQPNINWKYVKAYTATTSEPPNHKQNVEIWTKKSNDFKHKYEIKIYLQSNIDSIAVRQYLWILVELDSIRTRDANSHSDTETGTLSYQPPSLTTWTS